MTTNVITDPPVSIGEARVRIKFNASDDQATRTIVDSIKTEAAKLITLCEDLKKNTYLSEDKTIAWKNETARLYSLAQTAFEEAAMWAVKAATA